MRADWKKINTLVCFVFLFICLMGCEREVWQVRSPKEIEALNRPIEPLPDSVLEIPEFDGKHTLPVVRFAFDHFEEQWEYILFNNGDVLRNGKFIRNISQDEIQSLIHELNVKGLFGVHERTIFYRITGPRRMNIFKLLLSPPPQLSIPPPLIDGGLHTIQIDLKDVNYYTTFYAIFYYVETFPMCQDVHILDENIQYLRRFFGEYYSD